MKNKKLKHIELFESFDKFVNINWDIDGDIIIGRFVVNNKNYKILCKYIVHDFMTFKFTVEVNGKYSTKLLNDGSKNYMTVLSTIKKGIEFIFNKVAPVGIIFGVLDKLRGRKNIYDRFIINFVSKSNEYKSYAKESEDGNKIYVIYKKDVTPKELIEAIEASRNNIELI